MTYQSKWRGAIKVLHQKYFVRMKIIAAIHHLMLTHNEKDALDNLQCQLEALRKPKKGPNWREFEHFLDSEKKQRLAHHSSTAATALIASPAHRETQPGIPITPSPRPLRAHQRSELRNGMYTCANAPGPSMPTTAALPTSNGSWPPYEC